MKRTLFAAAAAAIAMSACSDLQAPQATSDDLPLAAAFAKTSGANVLDQVNAGLVGREYEATLAEIFTDPTSGEMGTVIFANNRGNKQLGGDYVPNDPRRANGASIVYVTDATEGATASGLGAGQTTAAIDAAMSTWDGVQCSDLSMINLGGVPLDLGFVQNILGFGGSQALFTDLMHAGWLPSAFFDLLAPGGGGFILGVTFTFNWVDPSGALTDVDGNGKTDVAFREIYYNDAFPWAADGANNFDVETVALHEAGHGLSQGHFGKIFRTASNGKLHFAPLAVMNASYSGIQRTIGKTDNAGHCSNWGAWPNN